MALYESNAEVRAVNNLTKKGSLPVQVKARNTAPSHPASILKVSGCSMFMGFLLD